MQQHLFQHLHRSSSLSQQRKNVFTVDYEPKPLSVVKQRHNNIEMLDNTSCR